MAKLIENRIGLMNFFQEWGVQHICNYYEAEKDLLGQEYCRMIDCHYSKEKGADILKKLIEEYPDAFRTLIKESQLSASEQLMPFLNADVNLSEDYACEISSYLLSDDCDENLKTICEALSKGFLLEWILFYLPMRQKEELINLIKEEKASSAKYREWNSNLIGCKLTRLEIIDKYSFYTHFIFYVYRRICLGYSLEIIFHAINVSQDLRLANSSEFISGAIGTHGIENDVQNFYSYLCFKQHSNWKEERLAYILPDDEDTDDDDYPRTNTGRPIDTPTAGNEVTLDKGEISGIDFFEDNTQSITWGEETIPAKKIIRSELLDRIKKACKGWQVPDHQKRATRKDWPCNVLWYDMFFFLWNIGVIKDPCKGRFLVEEKGKKEKKRNTLDIKPKCLSGFARYIMGQKIVKDKSFNDYLYDHIKISIDNSNTNYPKMEFRQDPPQYFKRIRKDEKVIEPLKEAQNEIIDFLKNSESISE